MLFLKESVWTVVAFMALFAQIALCRPKLKALEKRQLFDSDMLEDQVEQMEDQFEDLQEQTEECNERLRELQMQNLMNDMFGGGFGGGPFGGGPFGGGGFGGGPFGGGGFGDMFGSFGGLFFDDRRRRSAANNAERGVERTRRQWPIDLIYQRYLLSLYAQQQQQLLNNCLQQLAQFGVQPPVPPLNPVDTTPASVTPSDQAIETTTQAAETTTQAAETTTQAAETTTQAAETTLPPAADPTTIEDETTTDDN